MNTQRPLAESLDEAFPWCAGWTDALRALFAAYVEAKATRQVLDYDDLLLYWFHLMSEPALAERIGSQFDHVLVDEYQDTNALQAEILKRLKPSGQGVTVVGDDAQAIYSFRAATVDNILRFPGQYRPAGDRAGPGAELPLDPAHPGRRQRSHRAFARTVCQAAVQHARPRRTTRSWSRSRTRGPRSNTW